MMSNEMVLVVAFAVTIIAGALPIVLSRLLFEENRGESR